MKKSLFLMLTVLVAVSVISMSANTLRTVEAASCPQIVSCLILPFCDCDEPDIIEDASCTDFNGRSRQIAYCGTIGPPNLCTTNVHLTCF